jgi:hypothetical protein
MLSWVFTSHTIPWPLSSRFHMLLLVPQMAQVHVTKGDLDAALATYNQGLAGAPKNAELLTALGLLLLRWVLVFHGGRELWQVCDGGWE